MRGIFVCIGLLLLVTVSAAISKCIPKSADQPNVSCTGLSKSVCILGDNQGEWVCDTIDFPYVCYSFEQKGFCDLKYELSSLPCSCNGKGSVCSNLNESDCASASKDCGSNGKCRFDKIATIPCWNKNDNTVPTLPCREIENKKLCEMLGCRWDDAQCVGNGGECEQNSDCCSEKCDSPPSSSPPGESLQKEKRIFFGMKFGTVKGICVGCWGKNRGCQHDSDCCGQLRCRSGICLDCIPLGMSGCNQFPGTGGCCSGLVCNATGWCVSCYNKGTTCNSNDQCCSRNCQNSKCCLTGTSNEQCDTDNDCCQNFKCNPENKKCERIRPTKPSTPKIAPLEILPDGKVSCTENCAANSYRWRIDSTFYEWKFFLSDFDCAAEGCAPNQKIYLQVRNCVGELCNESDWSEPATVKPFPPPQVIQSSNYLQYIIYALLLAIGILALAYMFAKIFGIPHWIEIIKDELFQVILTGIVALLLVGITQLVNYYLGSALAALPDYTTTIPDNTNQIFKAAYQELGSLSSPSLLSQIQKENKKIAKEASKGIYCNMLGVGFSLVNCSPLNAFRGTLTSASFTVLAGMIDIYAQQILLSFGANFGFNLLIPLGLFFRCFKPTRQAGGALIAIGFGFYTVYPLVIVATLKTLALSETLQVPQPQTIPTISECDPYEIDVSKSRQQFQIYAAELSRPTISDYLTYEVLVKTIFLSILNLIITLGFISSFAKILGTEIDLAGLARIG